MKAPARINRAARSPLEGSALATVGILLILPLWAIGRCVAGPDFWLLLALLLAVSGFAFLAYRSDKRRAEARAWRVPEATLHLLSLLGGWPGALLAQRAYRHKTAKLSFQFVFWGIVLLHEYLAADSLLDWRLTNDAFQLLRQSLA